MLVVSVEGMRIVNSRQCQILVGRGRDVNYEELKAVSGPGPGDRKIIIFSKFIGNDYSNFLHRKVHVFNPDLVGKKHEDPQANE